MHMVDPKIPAFFLFLFYSLIIHIVFEAYTSLLEVSLPLSSLTRESYVYALPPFLFLLYPPMISLYFMKLLR